MQNTYKMKTFIISSILPILYLSLILLPTLQPSSATASAAIGKRYRCHENDKNALLKFKKDLGNPYHFTSWDPKTDCCDWYVVECDRLTNRVSTLNVISGDFSGHIPASIGDIAYLKTLIFHKVPKLTGTIPRSVTKLKHLSFFEISWTGISGEVPAFLGEMKNLTYLDLSYNKFSGTIPESLGLLRKLEAIRLDRNKLAGKIPESFGNFPAKSPPNLFLSHNKLTSTVPKSFGKLDFKTLDLSHNKLEGDASFLFETKKSLEIIDLSRNHFEFNISKVDGFPKSLISLDLSHNKIYGTLPKSLANLQNLQLFNISYNKLCGHIPQVGHQKKFDKSAFVHNKCLCGSPLPSC